MYRDLRGYIEALEEHGELIRIQDEVDWDLEASAIVRLGNQLDSKACLMENIRDYPGFRLLGGVFSNFRRAAIAIGLDPDTPVKEIQRVYRERLQYSIKPVIVPLRTRPAY